MPHLSGILGCCKMLMATFMLFAALSLQAQSPAWQMALAVGQGSGSAYTFSCAADGVDNVYVVGSFSGSVSFGSITLTSAGATDGFLAKWSNTSNAFVSAQRLGGQGNDEIRDVVVNGSAVYVAGYFSGTVAFGNTTLASAGNDVFVAKLSGIGSSSSFVWAQRISAATIYCSELAVNGTAVYITGSFQGTASFGSIGLVSTATSTTNGFVAKLTDAGSSSDFVWAQRMGSPGYTRTFASSMTVIGLSVYVAGTFENETSFGSISLRSAGPYDFDMFLVKLTDAGSTSSFVWAKQVGGVQAQQNFALASNGTDVYVAGTFYGFASFDNITLTSVYSGNDGFVAKLVDEGTTARFVWVQRAAGQSDDWIMNLSVSGQTVYVGGAFTGTAGFGNTTLTSTTTNSNLFIAKLTDFGNTAGFVWAQQATCLTSTSNQNIAQVVSSGNHVYVAGNITGSAGFGSYSLGSSAGTTSFLAALTDNTTLAATAASATTLAIYPNPARTTVQVPAATAATTLTLTDALGRTVRTATGAVLTVQGVAPGLYVLQAATPGQPVRTAKLTVE